MLSTPNLFCTEQENINMPLTVYASSTQSTSSHTPLSYDGSTVSSDCFYSNETASLESDTLLQTDTSVVVNNEQSKNLNYIPKQNSHIDVQSSLKNGKSMSYEKTVEQSSSDAKPHYKLRLRKQRYNCLSYNKKTDSEETPIHISKFFQPPILPPIEHFSDWAGVPKPIYEHILENDYSTFEAELLSNPSVTSNENLASLRRRESRLWICDCFPPSTEELIEGKLGCEQGCINRALFIECGPRCPAYNVCTNRQFHLRLYANTEPFYCGPDKGWGLRALEDLPKGTFIVEYAGEVIDFPEFRKRIRFYEKANRAHHYFMSLGPENFIDAGTKGNWARFVNHSCEPNAETQKWTVNGRLRIGFFAKTDIPAGEEITIDYQFVQYGVTEQKCYCGTPSCSGIMGASSKQLQDKVRIKDTRAVERRIIQLLTCKTLRNAEDVMFLLQVMVQEYLTRYTRIELLKLLTNTSNDTYLKLFRQYNGLELISSYMCDASEKDWDLKYEILVCLKHIPVSEQKQVKTDSSLMEIVKQWSIDPHFCRSRLKAVDSNEPESCANSLPDENESLISAADKLTPDTDQIPRSSSLNSLSKDPDSNLSAMSPQLSSVDEQIETDASKSTLEDAIRLTNSSVNLETGETEADSLKTTVLKVFTIEEEKIIISKICQLASDIISDWSKLPIENYRIPRIEREETEKCIMRSADISSSVVSKETSTDGFNSWHSISRSSSFYDKFNHSPQNTTMNILSKVDKSDKKRFRCFKSDRHIIRTKHRKQFEEDMRAAESAATSLLSESTESADQRNVIETELSNTRVPDLVRSLLYKALAKKLATNPQSEKDATCSLQEMMSLLSKKLCEFARLKDTKGLLDYLHCLADEKESNIVVPLEDSQTPTVACQKQTISALPPSWCSAVDKDTGLTYYYNSTSRAVQWEHPTLDELNEQNTSSKIQNKSPKDKKSYIKSVHTCVLKLLRPFRLPNCLTGRIANDEDLKYLAKKLSFTLAVKEQQRCRHKSPNLSSTTIQRFRRKITHYLTSQGEVYVRSNQKKEICDSVLEEEASCDMEIDESGSSP